MSEDQSRRLRQTGAYGAYRTILRRISGFTFRETGSDGWTASMGVGVVPVCFAGKRPTLWQH
jgi:hypothetical protein